MDAPARPGRLAAVEDHAAERVPASQLQSTWDISLVRMGLTVSASDLVFGYTLGLYFPFWTALGISLLVSVIIAAVAIGMGLIGFRERITFALATRYAFGRDGSRLPSLVMALVIAVFYGYILGITVDVFPGSDNTALQVLYCVALGIVFFAISALGFARGLKWMGRVGVPLMVLLVVVAVIVTVADSGGIAQIVNAEPKMAGHMTFAAILGAGISKWMAGAAISPDVMRFGRNKGSVYITTAAEFIVGNCGFNLLGLMLGLGLGTSDLGAAFGLIGLTWLATLAFLVQGITVETNELYAASLASANAVGISRTTSNVIVGLAGIVIGFWGLSQGVISSFLTFIGYIGYAIPVIPGIILVDYFLLHRGRYSTALDRLPAVNWRAVAAFLITVILNILAGTVLGDAFWRVLPVLGGLVYLLLSIPQLTAGSKPQQLVSDLRK